MICTHITLFIVLQMHYIQYMTLTQLDFETEQSSPTLQKNR